MKCTIHNLQYERCARCSKLARCPVYSQLSREQVAEYVSLLVDHVRRYPDKYKIGVVMAEQKMPKNIMILDDPPEVEMMTMSEIKGMSDEGKLKLVDKTIYQVAKQYEVRLKVDLVSVPLPDKEKKKKTRKPATNK